MPRQHDILIKELKTHGGGGAMGPRHNGHIKVMVLVPEDPHWAILETPLAKHLNRIPFTTYQHALKGYTAPLHQALGLNAKLTLRTLPQECSKAPRCPFHDARKCLAGLAAVPFCHQPVGIQDALQPYYREVLSALHDGCYVVCVDSEVITTPETT